MRFISPILIMWAMSGISVGAETGSYELGSVLPKQGPTKIVDSGEMLEITIKSVTVAPEVKGRRKWRVDFEFTPSEGQARLGKGHLYIHSPIIEFKKKADQLAGKKIKVQLKSPYVEGYNGYLEIVEE